MPIPMTNMSRYFDYRCIVKYTKCLPNAYQEIPRATESRPISNLVWINGSECIIIPIYITEYHQQLDLKDQIFGPGESFVKVRQGCYKALASDM